jgi:hypothetical protein
MIILLMTGIILVWLFGFWTARLLSNRNNFWEESSLGFILGIGIFTFLWFLLNLVGIKYNLLSGFTLVLGLNVLVLFISRIKYGKRFLKIELNTQYLSRLNFLEKFGIGMLVFLFISAFIQNLYWPIKYWDSLVLYDFRARLFAETGFMQVAISRGYFFGYPLLTSLAHTWVYILGGSNPSFLYTFFYFSFLLNFAINVKKTGLSRLPVIAMTLLAAVSPRLFEHTQWAYTNLPYTIYIVLGSIYLYWGIKKRDIGAYIISALLVGLSTWTRTAEPFWFSSIIVATVCPVILVKKWYWPLIYVSVVLVFMLPWRFFLSIYNQGSANVVKDVVSTTSGAVVGIQTSMIINALGFIAQNVLVPYLEYFVIFVPIIIIMLLKKMKDWTFPSLIFLNLALIFGGTLVFVRYISYYQEIPDSLTRMVMFVPPLIIYLLALFLNGLINKSK